VWAAGAAHTVEFLGWGSGPIYSCAKANPRILLLPKPMRPQDAG